MTALEVASPLRVTSHPLQRCGVRAVARLAERESPEEVTADDLDTVAGRLVRDIVRAATAPNDTPAYDWWKVLFALYPNSPATHSKRNKDPGELRTVIRALFAPSPPEADRAACGFCGQPAGVLWGKDKLPMFDSLKAVNTLPPGLPGWPVCRACRIALWALPYGAWVTAGSATVLTCPEDAVERRFVGRNVVRASRIQQSGFTGLSADASPETVTLGALRVHGRNSASGTTLWVFKNDNQDAWLRAAATRGGVPAFVRAMLADPDCRAGWAGLQRAMTQRDKDGSLKVSGVAVAARTLFDPADRPGGPVGDRLPRELLRRAAAAEGLRVQVLRGWRALYRRYMEVIHQMDVGQVKPACELITDWIMQEPNPRGRYNQYAGVAGSAFGLQRLLMHASNRLILDGRKPADVSSLAPALFAADGNGWRLRGLLFFDVIAELVNRDAPIGRKAGGSEEDEDPDAMAFDPDPVSGVESGEDYA